MLRLYFSIDIFRCPIAEKPADTPAVCMEIYTLCFVYINITQSNTGAGMIPEATTPTFLHEHHLSFISLDASPGQNTGSKLEGLQHCFWAKFEGGESVRGEWGPASLIVVQNPMADVMTPHSRHPAATMWVRSYRSPSKPLTGDDKACHNQRLSGRRSAPVGIELESFVLSSFET